jgi:hypothetical protein
LSISDGSLLLGGGEIDLRVNRADFSISRRYRTKRLAILLPTFESLQNE